LIKNYLLYRLLFVKFLILISFQALYPQDQNKLNHVAGNKLRDWKNPLTQWEHIAKPKIDSVHVKNNPETITVFFAPDLSYYPFREDSYHLFMESFRKSLGRRFRNYKIDVLSNNYSPDHLIPNIYRSVLPPDSLRFPVLPRDRKIPVRRLDEFYPEKGLYGNSVALWNSHGYYFEMTLDSWEWQRAKLFGTVEDISVMGYVVPYLTKMLENAGAIVYILYRKFSK